MTFQYVQKLEPELFCNTQHYNTKPTIYTKEENLIHAFIQQTALKIVVTHTNKFFMKLLVH